MIQEAILSNIVTQTTPVEDFDKQDQSVTSEEMSTANFKETSDTIRYEGTNS